MLDTQYSGRDDHSSSCSSGSCSSTLNEDASTCTEWNETTKGNCPDPEKDWFYSGDGDKYYNPSKGKKTQSSDPGPNWYERSYFETDRTDSLVADCDDGDSGITAASDGTCDGDGDTYIDETAGGLDCDDAEDTRNPGMSEVCSNVENVDNDCDGNVDYNDNDAHQWCKNQPGNGDKHQCVLDGSASKCEKIENADCTDKDGDGYDHVLCDNGMSNGRPDTDCDDTRTDGEYETPNTEWYQDKDGDNYWGKKKVQCGQPPGGSWWAYVPLGETYEGWHGPFG